MLQYSYPPVADQSDDLRVNIDVFPGKSRLLSSFYFDQSSRDQLTFTDAGQDQLEYSQHAGSQPHAGR